MSAADLRLAPNDVVALGEFRLEPRWAGRQPGDGFLVLEFEDTRTNRTLVDRVMAALRAGRPLGLAEERAEAKLVHPLTGDTHVLSTETGRTVRVERAVPAGAPDLEEVERRLETWKRAIIDNRSCIVGATVVDAAYAGVLDAIRALGVEKIKANPDAVLAIAVNDIVERNDWTLMERLRKELADLDPPASTPSTGAAPDAQAGAVGSDLLPGLREALRILRHPNAGMEPPDGGSPSQTDRVRNVAEEIEEVIARLTATPTTSQEPTDERR